MKKKFFQDVGGSICIGIGMIGCFVATGEPAPTTPLWVPIVIGLASACSLAVGYVLKSQANHIPYLTWMNR